MERTLILIKPDAMEKKLMGEIISIYEKKGLHIAALKIINPSLEIAQNHYSEHDGKPYFERLVNFISKGEVCAIVAEGEQAVEIVRKINGATDPLKAEAGSIRGRFAVSMAENTVHASDSVANAEREIKIWFPELS